MMFNNQQRQSNPSTSQQGNQGMYLGIYMYKYLNYCTCKYFYKLLDKVLENYKLQL